MMYLTEPTLGTLDLTCINGLVVMDFEIGSPKVRDVAIARSLADGLQDTSRFVGGRAVTVSIRLDQKVLPTQDLIDSLMPYMSPRYRPTLAWSIEEPVASTAHIRSLTVRGDDAPTVIEGDKYQTIVLQWVSEDPFTMATEDSCVTAFVTGTAEAGRAYDLSFDRLYPYSPPYGVTMFTPMGNAPMHWTGQISAQIEDPEIEINGVAIAFTGVTLAAGQTIDINTKDRTIYRNADPTDSLYSYVNFADWTWDDILVKSGVNDVRLQGTNPIGAPQLLLCYRDAWF